MQITNKEWTAHTCHLAGRIQLEDWQMIFANISRYFYGNDEEIFVEKFEKIKFGNIINIFWKRRYFC
jgi:hypothetical protein